MFLEENLDITHTDNRADISEAFPDARSFDTSEFKLGKGTPESGVQHANHCVVT